MSNHSPLPKMTKAFLKKVLDKIDVRGPDECWPWAGRLNREYGQISLGGKQYGAHRLAYFIHYGADPGKMLVCHTCDVPGCCNPAHLLLGTNQDNVDDMLAKGRDRHDSIQGEKHHLAKLTEQDVRDIRASDESDGNLAKEYGVYQTTIMDARRRKTWKHVE